ncbi:RNA polymerase sigma-70 factor, ECF subfamily [Tissierella praeacuta DSM 18095]|uniref:RNA polymerase sigma-70 factor, ECF subfamily n=1 Tax=Tissierella praeacuta DSM 18095 TaxID=1123404 RepID=A0A1M4VK08_9FIRM|nr:RNA polymerase sigma factor [Tissierella praeacuta]SHE69162.1 RNA polymerase sigma-70 factor, ECF subfamily [Tissierella praeacuta DSM 18095]SUO99108.1 Sigma-24 [Tissierella praeacuta]
MLDDKILYKSFLEGSISSFETLVLRHKDNLIYFISRYTGDIFAAEDIAQDVFAYVYVYKEKYNFDYSFKTYIYTLGRNKAIDYVRKQSKLKVVPFERDNEILVDKDSIEEKIIKDEEKKLLLDSLKKLKPDYENAIYLADFEELSYGEISKILGKTLGQTKVLIHRARKALKEIFEKGAEKDES